MIQSFRVDIAPDANNQVFLILDTVLDGIHAFTALGLGRIERNEPLLSQVAQATLSALLAYADREALGNINFVEIATQAAAPMRVRKALECAHQKDVVFFLCRSPDVYDAAWTALNVRLDLDTSQLQ